LAVAHFREAPTSSASISVTDRLSPSGVSQLRCRSRVRTGVPWRDIPERYGPWETVYKRFTRWQTDGTWARIQEALHTQADAAGALDWDAQIDSSVVRAHQHAAGASKRGTPRARQDTSKRSVGHGVG
jgi:transposase